MSLIIVVVKEMSAKPIDPFEMSEKNLLPL